MSTTNKQSDFEIISSAQQLLKSTKSIKKIRTKTPKKKKPIKENAMEWRNYDGKISIEIK